MQKEPSKTENKTKEEIGKLYHDLRTPLTVMKCHIELLLMDKDKKALDSEALTTIKILEKEIDRMTKILKKS